MPNFTPTGKIYIGHVPFDNSYRHTMTFSDATAQQAYFAGVCTAALSGSDYTYVRMNNAIRVPFNAESLYTYNYVMYQNSNYGSKWFYAFIVGINYVNENMTELLLELDVMQTWYFDYTLKQCFVEREHVDDDTVGLHINPEPEMAFEQVMTTFVRRVMTTAITGTEALSSSYIVVLVNVKLTEYTIEGVFAGYVSSPDKGGYYQGQYNACKCIIFPCTTSGVANFDKFIDAVNAAGAADSICDVFTAPKWAMDTSAFTYYGGMFTGEDVYTYPNTSQVMMEDIDNGIPYPTTLGSYTPRNAKLLTYPYTYLEVGDFSGRHVDYRYEFMAVDSADKVHLKLSCAAISDGDAYITPFGYNGAGYDFDPPDWKDNSTQEPFTFSITNKISWVYGTYQNWIAQNGITQNLNVLASLALLGSGAGIAARGAAGAAGAATSKALRAGQKGVESGLKMAGAGIYGANSVAANITQMQRHPNKAMGNTGTNSKLQNNYCGYYYANITLREEFAEIIDGFFDMFGYEVDVVKVPNREGRTSWNYVKTQNACHYGNVPADMMAQINSIYDAGITFWHTSDVGNYSLSNAIVTP